MGNRNYLTIMVGLKKQWTTFWQLAKMHKMCAIQLLWALTLVESCYLWSEGIQSPSAHPVVRRWWQSCLWLTPLPALWSTHRIPRRMHQHVLHKFCCGSEIDRFIWVWSCRKALLGAVKFCEQLVPGQSYAGTRKQSQHWRSSWL